MQYIWGDRHRESEIRIPIWNLQSLNVLYKVTRKYYVTDLTDYLSIWYLDCWGRVNESILGYVLR